RLPPSAGSASGVLPNPVGYNRVYVQVGKDLTYANWWEGLRAGRSFVTNGPLLRVTANGQLPGYVFKADKQISLNLAVKLVTQDPIPFVEIIKNGQMERRVPWDKVMKAGALGDVEFKESGWFLVRVIADNSKTFRFASTAPFYVDIGNRERISKKSANFFLDWMRERMGRIKLDEPRHQQEVARYHQMAEEFWFERVS